LKNFRLPTLVAGLIAAAPHAQAAQPISLLLPVTYEYETSVLHKAKESCKLDERLGNGIAAELQKRAGEPRTVSTAATGVVLHVELVGGNVLGGGGWTGSKSLTLKVQELQDGEVVRQRGFSRKGRGGLAGPFEGTCGILEGLADDLAKDIVDWSGVKTDAKFDADLAAHREAKAQAAAEAASDATK
jgi:hypothetical protein